MYQSTAISNLFTTVGYEIPVITVLALVILPRGKFVQMLALNLLAVCVGSALSLLVLWSSIQARINTSHPAPSPPSATLARAPYNSSQSAVCAVWLFVNIWLVNLIRAKLPSFNLPAIVYSIFVNIAATNGPALTNVAQAEALVTQLLTSMLLALGISTGVSLFVFPISSRMIVQAQFKGAIGIVRRAVGLQKDYLQTLESEDMFALVPVETSVGRAPEAEKKRRRLGKKAQDDNPPPTKEVLAAQALKESISQLRDLAGKLYGELKFAKRDAAWGKLDAHDLSEIYKLFRKIFIPM